MTLPEGEPAQGLTHRSLRFDAGSTLAAGGATLLAVAVANILIGRMLGVDGQGRVAAATLVPLIAGYAGELGLPVATGYLANADPSHRATAVATARTLAIGMSAVLIFLSTVAVVLLPLPDEVKGLSVLFGLFIPLNLFYRLHLALLQADLRFRTFNAVRVSGAFVYLAVLVVLAATDHGTTSRVVGALLLGNIVWCGLSFAFAGSPPWLGFDRPVGRTLMGYGVRAHLGNVSTIDALKLDQLVLALLLDTTDLGLYVAAMTVVTGNRVVGTSIGALCFPMASRGDRGRDVVARSHFHALLGGALLLSCAIAAVEVLLGGRLLTVLFGASFESGGSALRVLAVGSVFMNLRQVYADWLRGCGRPGVVTLSELAGVASLATLCALLWDGSVKPVAWSISIASVVALGGLLAGAALRPSSRGSADLRIGVSDQAPGHAAEPAE